MMSYSIRKWIKKLFALARYLVSKGYEYIYLRWLDVYLYQIRCTIIKWFTPFTKKASGSFRIGIFIPTLSALSGAERYTASLTAVLLANTRDTEIDLICTNVLSKVPSLYDVPTREEILKKFDIDLTGAHIKYEVLDYQSTVGVWRNNLRAVARMSRKYDLFINCQHNLYASFSQKSLFICHFPHRPLGRDLTIGRARKRQIGRLFSHTYDFYLSNSEFTQGWQQTYWPQIDPQKMKVLYPPVLHNDQRLSKPSQKKNRILTCGRIDPEKKMLELVKLFDGNPDKFAGYEFHIAGSVYFENPVSTKYFDEISQIANKNSNIYVHVNISYADLINLYTSSRIYWHGMGYGEDVDLYPIKTEHFGITIIEAMTFGCIPVVHNSGGPAILMKKMGFDTTWSSGQEAVAIINGLISEDKNIQSMSEKVIEFSRQFSLEQFEANLLSLIRQNELISPTFLN